MTRTRPVNYKQGNLTLAKGSLRERADGQAQTPAMLPPRLVFGRKI